MNKTDLLRTLIKSDTRSIIIESGSPVKSKNTLINILQDKHCSFSFDGHCGTCKDCKRIEKLESNIHPDVFYFGGPLFSIDNARMLIRQTEAQPLEFDERYIIFDVDKYSPESQNAILKILEEDFDFESNARFIFIVRSSSVLLPTIQSRSVTVVLESNSTREFESLVLKKQYTKKEYVAYLCSYKEVNLNKALYIKEKFNLNIEEISDKLQKMYVPKELSQDFFTNLEDLKAYPFIFVYKAIEYDFVVNNKQNMYELERFYRLFYRKNFNKSKNVRDNLAVMLRMWYFLNKREFFNQYYKE